MFDVAEVTADGAVLHCAYWMERGETFALELGFDDGTSVRVSARVVDIIDEPNRPAMKVLFDPDHSGTAKLAKRCGLSS